jgi:hypothetical protein
MAAIFDIGYLLAFELKKGTKKGDPCGSPVCGSRMRLRVSARAPPDRGDPLILDRERGGDCHTHAHAGILPGRAVGRGIVEKGCH